MVNKEKAKQLVDNMFDQFLVELVEKVKKNDKK